MKRTAREAKGFVDPKTWQPRPVLAVFVRVLLWVIPIVVGLGSTILLRKILNPTFGSKAMRYAWFAEMFALASVVSSIVGKVTQRYLPLSTLCMINLSFPDEAPNRMKLALRVGNTKTADVVREFQESGIAKSPQDAAVQVLSLIEALNRHDRRTRGHSEKVRAYADVIAEEMALSEHDRNLLRWGAMLHDIGKLTVSPEILNKPGRPSEEEWESIKGHPQAAVDRLGPLASWLGDWVLAASQHHEKFDGSGYPLGLKGNQISLAGRIVAVADSFEVMTATRSYKKPMSHEAARQELVRCSGTHFDPVVVRSMVKVGVGSKASLSSGFFGTILDGLLSSPTVGQIVSTTVRSVAGPVASAAAPLAMLPAMIVGSSTNPELFTPQAPVIIEAPRPDALAFEAPVDSIPTPTQEDLIKVLGPIDPTERPKTKSGTALEQPADGGTFVVSSEPEPTTTTVTTVVSSPFGSPELELALETTPPPPTTSPAPPASLPISSTPASNEGIDDGSCRS